MSKAYQCDGCQEFFPGKTFNSFSNKLTKDLIEATISVSISSQQDRGKDICKSCARAYLQMLIDTELSEDSESEGEEEPDRGVEDLKKSIFDDMMRKQGDNIFTKPTFGPGHRDPFRIGNNMEGWNKMIKSKEPRLIGSYEKALEEIRDKK